MMDQQPANARTSKRKGIRLFFVVALLGCMVGWYFFGDALRERLDRALVRNARHDPGLSDIPGGARPGGTGRMGLPSGKWMKAGPDVFCYARSLSHHTAFGFRRGYSYVQVNGKTYVKEQGPCGNYLIVVLGPEPLDENLVVTEELVLQALAKDDFHPIRNTYNSSRGLRGISVSFT